MHPLALTRRLGLGGVTLTLLSACSPTALVDVPVPGSVVVPEAVTTPAGAIQLYNAAVGDFAIMFGGGINNSFIGGNYIGQTGIFTDELQSSVTNFNEIRFGIDERTAGSPGSSGFRYQLHGDTYRVLQHARTTQHEAREALQLFAPSAPKAFQAQMYAFEGYSVLLIAELFCSGIPLSTVRLTGSTERSRGYSTQEMFERAIALFDSAIAITADSARFLNLAKVGKARALLNLGRFAEIATVVQGIPTDFTFKLTYAANGNAGQEGLYNTGNGFGTNPTIAQVVDNEGGNGLPWSTDPRTAVTTLPDYGTMQVTAKYSITLTGTLDATVPNPSAPARLADGLEARLIEAEANLATGGSAWLATLNMLRSTCVGTAPCASVPGLTAAQLPPLSDPGSASARLDLLMSERAMWLFVTGHRQGDLRRLAAVYNRPVSSLWPTGVYRNPGFPPNIPRPDTDGKPYGVDVVFQPSEDEKKNNSLYDGCNTLNP